MYRPDALDRQIIALLQRDGRACYAEIARALDVSEATARRRVERLVSEGLIRVVACVEPHRVGLQAEALVYLQCDLDKLTQLGRELAAMPEVREVPYTSGVHDLVLRVALPSGEDLWPFLTERIAPLPGIKSSQTAHILRTEKRLHDWQVAELPAREAHPAPPAGAILLVEDDPDFATAAQMVLEAAGYRVMLADSGQAAWKRLEEERPALILVDLIMETPLAGVELAKAVRADERLHKIPLLAISAIRSTEWAGSLPDSAELPFDEFVDKPIEPQVLVEKVRRFLSG